MQTHKFKWKLFDVEYSSVKIWELEWEIRVDSEYYDVEYIKIHNNILTKNNDLFFNNVIEFGSWKNLEQSENWIPFLRTQNVRSISIDEEGLSFTNETNIKLLDIWDLIFVRVWMWVWDSSVVYWKMIWWTFSDNVLRLKLKNINPFYSSVFFNTNLWQVYFSHIIKWTARPLISKENFKDLLIPIPTQSFQEKIQELVIESYNQKELSEKLYKEAEKLLLSELDLLDYKPKTKTIKLMWWYEIQVPENHSTTNYEILKQTDRFDSEYWDYDFVEIRSRAKNIKSEKLWNLVNYKKWIEVWSEAYIEDNETENIEDKKYFVRVSNFWKFWMTLDNSKFIKNNHFEKLRNYQPQKWEILFSKDGTAWISYLLRENIDWIISWWILRFQNISHIPSEYLELVLNSILIQKEIERQTNWALIQHLKITDAMNFDIPIISDDKIEIITDKIKQSFIAKTKSKDLLEIAKKSVEIYIEQDEQAGFEFIKQNIN